MAFIDGTMALMDLVMSRQDQLILGMSTVIFFCWQFHAAMCICFKLTMDGDESAAKDSTSVQGIVASLGSVAEANSIVDDMGIVGDAINYPDLAFSTLNRHGEEYESFVQLVSNMDMEEF